MSCELTASLCYTAGDDILLRFAVTDKDGVVVNITGFTPRFAIGRAGEAVVGTETSPASATAALTTPASGLFEVEIAGAETTDLRGTYHYEAEVEDTAGAKATVAEGYITFTASRAGLV